MYTSRLNSLALAFLLILFAGASSAAERIFFEDFEDDVTDGGWIARGGWSFGTANSARRVQSNPYAGSWCLRGNLFLDRPTPDCVDPLIVPVGNGQIECRFDNIALPLTPNRVYIAYRVRLDDAIWYSYDTPEKKDGKMGYITDDGFVNATGNPNAAVEALWWSQGSGASEPDEVVTVSSNQRYDDPWRLLNWGAYNLKGNTPPIDAGNEWHKVEMYFDYVAETLELWVDDVKFVNHATAISASPHTPGTLVVTDKIPIHPTTHIRGIQFWHTTSSKVTNSLDRPGSGPGDCALGWQIDNIEVWDGLPTLTDDPVGAPAAPTGPWTVDGDTFVDVAWAANTEADLDYYTVWWNLTGDDTDLNSYGFLANTSIPSYRHAGQVNGTTLYYVITATDQFGQRSGKSEQVDGTPTGAALTDPVASGGITDGH